MDSFADSFRTYNNAKRAKGKVRVAVIDDGIDGTLGTWGHSIVDGKLFVAHEFDRIEEYFVCHSGHGTLMAELIRRICPVAQLYIAKLTETRGYIPAMEAAEVNSLLLFCVTTDNFC